MSRRVIRAVRRQTFTFPLQASQTQYVMAAERLDSSQWREGTLAVRVHSVTLASGQSIDVLAVIDGHTAEDPATGFYSSPSATVTLNSSSSAPSFHLQLLDDQPIGGLVSIVVGGTQGGSATSFSATLSVDLVLKD